MSKDEALQQQARKERRDTEPEPVMFENDVDELSNSVLDLIKVKDFDGAERVCCELQEKFPDQVDGLSRMAEVCEARGEKAKAAEYLKKAADFMRAHEGFDDDYIEQTLEHSQDTRI